MLAQAEELLKQGSGVNSSLFPAIFKIFSLWQLSSDEQKILLGLNSEEIFNDLKCQPGKVPLTKDLLERSSYILGIYKSLQILLPDHELADQWLNTPNDNPLFNGTVPLDRLLAGLVVDLAVVRNFLDAERGGW